MTRADLPPANTQRWVASRKAVVVRGVLYGLISTSEAKTRYGICDEEFNSWVAAVAEFGDDALKVTTIKNIDNPRLLVINYFNSNDRLTITGQAQFERQY